MIIKTFHSFIALSLLGIAVFAPNAMAQATGDQPILDSTIRQNNQNFRDPNIATLLNEIKRVRDELNLLRQRVYLDRGEQVPNQPIQSGNLEPSIAGQMQIRIGQLEAEIRSLNGRLEEASFLIQSLADQLDMVNRDISFRLDQLTTGEKMAQNKPTAAAPKPDATSSNATNTSPSNENQLGVLVTNEQGDIIDANINQNQANLENTDTKATQAQATQALTADEAYRDAFALLRSRDYIMAQTAFEQFLKDYPKSELAGNASYWLGETFYVRQEFQLAANEFINTYTGYPNSTKASHALLKLALSLNQIEKPDTACEVLSTLKQEYPDTDEQTISRANNLAQDLSCP